MLTTNDIEIATIAYHRNGIGGEPFFAVTFRDHKESRDMLAVVFNNDHSTSGFVNPRTAVFDLNLLSKGDIKFGSNSWRGDNYDHIIRAAIKKDYPEFD